MAEITPYSRITKNDFSLLKICASLTTQFMSRNKKWGRTYCSDPTITFGFKNDYFRFCLPALRLGFLDSIAPSIGELLGVTSLRELPDDLNGLGGFWANSASTF